MTCKVPVQKSYIPMKKVMKVNGTGCNGETFSCIDEDGDVMRKWGQHLGLLSDNREGAKYFISLLPCSELMVWLTEMGLH